MMAMARNVEIDSVLGNNDPSLVPMISVLSVTGLRGIFGIQNHKQLMFKFWCNSPLRATRTQ